MGEEPLMTVEGAQKQKKNQGVSSISSQVHEILTGN